MSITEIVRILVNEVLDHAAEIEHQFMDEYKDLKKEDIIRDFAQSLTETYGDTENAQ